MGPQKDFKKKTFNFPAVLGQLILRKALLLFSKKENRNFKPLEPRGLSAALTFATAHRVLVHRA